MSAWVAMRPGGYPADRPFLVRTQAPELCRDVSGTVHPYFHAVARPGAGRPRGFWALSGFFPEEPMQSQRGVTFWCEWAELPD
jgi:hypothetical protein